MDSSCSLPLKKVKGLHIYLTDKIVVLLFYWTRWKKRHAFVFLVKKNKKHNYSEVHNSQIRISFSCDMSKNVFWFGCAFSWKCLCSWHFINIFFTCFSISESHLKSKTSNIHHVKLYIPIQESTIYSLKMQEIIFSGQRKINSFMPEYFTVKSFHVLVSDLEYTWFRYMIAVN